jgi:spiro-SPASM protein
MVNLALINCIHLSPYAVRDLGSGSSSLDVVLNFAARLPGVTEIVCLVAPDQKLDAALAKRTIHRAEPDPEGLFAAMNELVSARKDLDSLFYLWGDTPLLDPGLAERMWASHRRYRADFTFADAYPAGLAVEILRVSAVAPLAHLAKGRKGPIERDAVFEVLRKDINAFEIETEIPSIDLRLLRIRLAAENASGFLLLKRVLEASVSGADALLHHLRDHQEKLRTLPAYLSVQVSGGCPQACGYCPYSTAGGDVLTRRDSMSLQDFRKILADFYGFTGGGVVNLSPWGEPAQHPEIGDLLKAILEYPELTGVIETAGLGWDRAMLERTAKVAEGRLTWIVSLDALHAETYRKLRGPGFEEAMAFAGTLLELFGDSAYVQAVRMDTNEEELEAFYRSWKERTENIIIQKYDWFSGKLPQRRVADISPLTRNPCWHLKRDLTVLLNGDVPLCREDIDGTTVLGNVFSDGIGEIWKRGEEYHLRHVRRDYPEICRDCDEYYTFNY